MNARDRIRAELERRAPSACCVSCLAELLTPTDPAASEATVMLTLRDMIVDGHVEHVGGTRYRKKEKAQ